MPDSENIGYSLAGMKILEDLASERGSAVHEISPSVKIAGTFLFIFTVVSFNPYDFSALLPFLAYPVIAASLARIPFSMLLKRSAIALPFVAFAGIANLIFDSSHFETPFGFAISGGAVSFAVLILKTMLTVSAALILAATTPINAIASGMRRFKIPCVLVLQFVLTCRYIDVILNEASRIINAYMLRAPGVRIIKFKDWPALVARLFLKSLDRAERVYGAMLCRGFNARHAFDSDSRESMREIFYLMAFAGICIFLRLYNLSDFFGKAVLG